MALRFRLLASSTLFVVRPAPVWRGLCLGPDQGSYYRAWFELQVAAALPNVSYIDKRLLTLDSTDAEPMLTAEKQRVVIDWYVRWRITEPTEYIRNGGLNESAGASQLNRVVRNAFQEEINKRTVKEPGRCRSSAKRLMADVKQRRARRQRLPRPGASTRVPKARATTPSATRS